MVSLMPVALALKFGIDSFEQIDLLPPLVGAVMEGQVQDGAVTMRVVVQPVSYTHLRAHETVLDLVCLLLLEKKKRIN